MSTPADHIRYIREAKAARDSAATRTAEAVGQQAYQSMTYLFVDVHLDEIAAAMGRRRRCRGRARSPQGSIAARLLKPAE